MTSPCLIILALSLGQSFDSAQWTLSPQFASGLELVYRGTCTDESLVPGVQHSKQYDLETILLTQGKGSNGLANAVLQTSVSVHEPKDQAMRDAQAVPGSVRLELVQINRRGGLRRRGDDADAALQVALDGPPLVETAAFFDAPLTPVNRLSYWEEHEDFRPRRGWHILLTKEHPSGVERTMGVPCLKLQWTQETLDWREPRADSTAWRRQDTLWFAYQTGQVFRVERIVERRDPGRKAPTRRITTKYDLTSRFQYTDRFLEDRNDEIVKIVKFQEEAAPYLRLPALYRRNIDGLIARITAFVESTPVNPYRKAMLFLKSKLENARGGELPVHHAGADTIVDSHRPLSVGDRVPDFAVTELTVSSVTNAGTTRRFHKYLGQPILVLYYDPARENSREVLQCAEKLCDEHGDKMLVLGMALTDDVDLVRRQHEEMKLSFPVLDGKGMLRTFGVDGTPRVVILDADGLVELAFTGWGYHIPAEIAGEIRALLRKR